MFPSFAELADRSVPISILVNDLELDSIGPNVVVLIVISLSSIPDFEDQGPGGEVLFEETIYDGSMVLYELKLVNILLVIFFDDATSFEEDI